MRHSISIYNMNYKHICVVLFILLPISALWCNFSHDVKPDSFEERKERKDKKSISDDK